MSFLSKIFHRMEEPKNRGCLNCNRNSIEIYFRNTCVFTNSLKETKANLF